MKMEGKFLFAQNCELNKHGKSTKVSTLFSLNQANRHSSKAGAQWRIENRKKCARLTALLLPLLLLSLYLAKLKTIIVSADYQRDIFSWLCNMLGFSHTPRKRSYRRKTLRIVPIAM